jgi:thioredoxin-disulfide reductase
MAEYRSKVLIIGSGPAGYTAGIYAARAGLKPILVSGLQPGGQLTITTEVENFPGFPEPIHGTDLMQRMRSQAENVGVTIIDDNIIEVDFSSRPFVCNSENYHVYTGETLIIATGASAKWLGLESEEKFRGYGVSGCATCDGFFYRNRNVAVVGGGNTAAEEALYLSNFAKSVTLIHRRNSLRADQTMQKRILENPKINIEWDTVIEEILGTENPKSVTGLRLKNVKNDSTFELAVDGLFIAVGHHPNTELFKKYLQLDNNGYIVTLPGSSKTNIEGVFAAGDVKDPQFRQAVIAAGSGCIAALEAEKFLNENL